MNRVIKFRAWDKKEKEMIYEALEIKNIGLGEGSVLVNTDTQKGNELVWMQYIGLKDKNGKFIYEGDIVKIKVSVLDFIGVVNWDSQSAFFCVKITEDIMEHFGAEIDEVKIIGNIFENPKLLGKEE